MATININTEESLSSSQNSKKESPKETPVQFKKTSKRRVVFSRIKRRLLKHVWLVRAGILAGIVLGIYLLFLITGFVLGKTSAGFYFNLGKDFVFTPEKKLESIGGRTNILILGKAGGNNDAPDLTDTIIFASVDIKNPKVSMISLPRDIWIPELRAKLNSTYYWGNEKEENGGLKLTKSSVEKIVGQPVAYGVVIDFEGFKEIIDVMGGIEIDVETSFIDEWYPIAGKEDDECDGDEEFKCRYETVKFEKGRQLMDGDTALKFTRSRNAEGDEGTDFARAQRQQKVISAVKNKGLSREILFSYKKLLQIKDVLAEYVETDIDPSAAAILARFVYEARDSINSHVLSEDFLVNPPKSYRYDNLYVFIPKADPSVDSAGSPQAGSGQAWSEVHGWVECVLGGNDCD